MAGRQPPFSPAGRNRAAARPEERARPGPGAPRARGRWPAIDLLRGGAILAMIAYHFCFDLAQFGWLVADFGEDWRWIAFRMPILGTFLFVAGASLALAAMQGQAWPQFWRRIAIVAGAALLVTAGSYAMFPQSYIWFGVLHAIAVMSLLARPLLRAGGWLLPAGLAALAIGFTVRLPLFDQPPLQWIGLMTFKPRTEDYVPLLPWFGMVLAGAGTAWLAAHSGIWSARLAAWRVPRPLAFVSWLGRHSLLIYLLHQPLLLGLLTLARQAG